MDNQRNHLLSLAVYCQGKSMEELRHSLLCTTLELEGTRLAAQEELRKRDDQVAHLRDLLEKAIKERDEAQDKYQKLLLEKLLFQQPQQQQHHHHHPLSGVSSIEDEPRRGGIDSNIAFSSSDCDESIVSSPPSQLTSPTPPPQQQQPQQSLLLQSATKASETAVIAQNSVAPDFDLVCDKPLPEKGRLLQAVMKAGPLLQTLLLAGPLPQWRHPPPPLESFEIPPVTIPSPPQPQPQPQPPLGIPSPYQQQQLLLQETLVNMSFCNGTASCGRLSRKRGLLCDGSGCPTETKYQRVVLN